MNRETLIDTISHLIVGDEFIATIHRGNNSTVESLCKIEGIAFKPKKRRGQLASSPKSRHDFRAKVTDRIALEEMLRIAKDHFGGGAFAHFERVK